MGKVVAMLINPSEIANISCCLEGRLLTSARPQWISLMTLIGQEVLQECQHASLHLKVC